MGELFAPEHLLSLLIFAVAFVGVHFIPTIVVGARRATNFWWIFAINFFLSWTLVGWIVALVWAIRDEPCDLIMRQVVAAPPYNL